MIFEETNLQRKPLAWFRPVWCHWLWQHPPDFSWRRRAPHIKGLGAEPVPPPSRWAGRASHLGLAPCHHPSTGTKPLWLGTSCT